MDKINIIMPCFYSPEVIRPALEMIAKQTMKDRVVLSMVDDYSEYDYMDLIHEFEDDIFIRTLGTDKNMGPGMARQIGLDNCEEKYVMFHDDDDVYKRVKNTACEPYRNI